MKRAAWIIGMLLLGVTASCALADQEESVFQDIAGEWHELLYGHPGGWRPSQEQFQQIFQVVANKYNISVDEVKKIDGNGIFQELQDSDIVIYRDLSSRLNASASSVEDARRIHSEIAAQYGITLSRLYEIEYVAAEGG